MPTRRVAHIFFSPPPKHVPQEQDSAIFAHPHGIGGAAVPAGQFGKRVVFEEKADDGGAVAVREALDCRSQIRQVEGAHVRGITNRSAVGRHLNGRPEYSVLAGAVEVSRATAEDADEPAKEVLVGMNRGLRQIDPGTQQDGLYDVVRIGRAEAPSGQEAFRGDREPGKDASQKICFKGASEKFAG